MNLIEIYSTDNNINSKLLNKLVSTKIKTKLKLSQESFSKKVELHRTYID